MPRYFLPYHSSLGYTLNDLIRSRTRRAQTHQIHGALKNLLRESFDTATQPQKSPGILAVLPDLWFQEIPF